MHQFSYDITHNVVEAIFEKLSELITEVIVFNLLR